MSNGPLLPGAKRCGAAVLAIALVLSGCGRVQEPREPAIRTPSAEKTEEPRTPGELVLTPVTPTVPAAAPPAARPTARPAPLRPQPPPPPPPNPAPVPGPVVSLSPATPGNYQFAETGLTRIRGCLTLDQPPPSPSRLSVAPPAGNLQRFDRDQKDPLGSGTTTLLDAEYRPDGIYLTYLRQTQTSLLASQPTEFRPAPPVLLLPASAGAGHAWSFSLTSVDGQVRIESQNRLESTDEPVTLRNGHVVSARRVLADGKVTGQSSQGTLDLVRRQTTWYAPASGLPVKEAVEMTGRVGLCNIESRTEATLQSL